MNHLFRINQFSPYAKTKDAATQRTIDRKNERVGKVITRKIFRGTTNKVAQKLIDTKDKFDRPTGVMIVNERKTQRNDKCPCGSEKKFKNCHLS